MTEIELLQVALGVRQGLSHVPTADEWNAMFRFAHKQVLQGIMFGGVERLPKECCPPQRLLLKWFAMAERIKRQNAVVDGAVQKLIETDFEGCSKVVLKGQAVALYYPEPWRRMPGDIDIWCVRHGMTLSQSRQVMARVALARVPDAGIQPHHTDWPSVDGVHVEIHFTPSTVCNPLYNHRVQRYFEQNLLRCRNNRLPVDVDFVFQLIHVRKHLISEGVGMRHVIDLYMTYCSLTSDENRAALRNINSRLLAHLGLLSFAEAMMWVLHRIDNNVNPALIGIKADARRGAFVWHKVMDGGNFGWYSTDNGEVGANRLAHLLYFGRIAWLCFKYFPAESICSPFFRIYIKLWRRQFRNLTAAESQ